LVIGTDVQAYDADLQAIAALAGTSGILRKTAANTWSLDTASYFVTPATLTTNFVSKWGGSAFANSQIFDNGTSIGIGTTSPTYKVDIVNATGIILRHSETINTTGAFRIIGGSYTNNGMTGFIFGANINNNTIQYGGGTGLAEPATQHQFYVGAYGTKAVGTEVMRIANSGFVGINTTTPAYTLDVSGTIRTTSILITGGATVGSFLKCNNVNGTSVWSSVTTSDISNLSSWAGSTSITTLGTITAGTWNGTAIATTRGGTGLTALGTANQILRVNAGATALEYFTPTYISGNQTITLSGIVTGSGTTAITTAIADAALSIAKTSGLQTALDSKQATLSGTGLVLSTAGTITYVTNNSDNWNTAFAERNRWDGGATGLVAATGRASLGLVIGTDVQAYDADLQAIGALAGTSGILRKTAANTWSLDTNNYLTANQSISITGDANGSGTTSIALTLANVATEGTYRSVTINAKGLVTSGTNPTTLAGYAITDAYTKSESDARFVSLTGSYVNPSWITSLAWTKLTGVPTTFAPSAHTLDSHSNVTITSNSAGELLRWNGTAWINSTLAESGIQPLDGDLTSIAGLTGTTGLLRKTAANTFVLDTATYLTGITSLQVTTALGFTPYNATNPSGFITSSGSITGSAATLTTARTFTIGTTGKTFNGSANVAWTLGEIGAAPTVHTHAAADIVSGVIATARLASGTASATTFLRGDQTWATLPAPTLTSTRIGFGSGSNLLTSSANFAFEDDRIISIKNGGTSKMEVARFAGTNNYGLYVTSGNLELQSLTGGTVVSKSNHNFEGRILLNNAAGTAGQVLTSQGSGTNPTWTTVSGGTQDLDDVLGVGNTAINKQIILNGTNSVLDSAAIMFYRNGVEKGKLYYDNQFLTLDRLRLTSTSKIQILSEDSVGLYGTSTIIGSLSGTGTRMVVADATGVLSTQAIPSGGIGNIDQVLAAGNTSINKSFNMQNGGLFFNSQNNSLVGGISGSSFLDGSPASLSISTATNIMMQITAGSFNVISENVIIGIPNTTGLINLQGTPFNFNENAQNLGMGQNGSQWGADFNQALPQPGDRVVFFWDGTRFVMSHVRTYAGAGGKTYLTID
jgi:hypothetical protein